ncbi:putative RNA recognition motif domain, nucleotide-binding alpha-beta plait domain superfamily [Helianthus annuus]|nr:putative RNA recognition motif domain, nucleotide-binding alpha-beta plait domain superfamily [Helianthus annuus]KAJ0490781.1 putative RNA recognition motif domain, nucleotide-binding alpha-beta plait domain superfamily [Helianthus annuus]
MAGMGLDDDGQPWAEVQHKKNRRNRPDGVEMTFLIQNLPDQVSKGLLWRIFQPYGFITDAYVARKKDAKGNRFGFVRYVVEGRVEEVLKAMNSVKVFGAKLNVLLAKYDKNHKRFNYTSDMLGRRQEWKPKETMPGNKGPTQGASGPSYVQEGTSFADILRGKKENSNAGAKVISVEGKGSLYPLHCIGRSVIGKAMAEVSINMLKQEMEKEGMLEVGLSFIGGVSYMLIFKDRVTATASMEVHAKFFQQNFVEFYLWNGEEIPFSRVALLSIMGVPFIIRDNTIYDKIGKVFGEVIQGSKFSWQDEDNSSGSVKVLTSQISSINEAVVIKWANKSNVVWVSEIQEQKSMDSDQNELLDESESENESDSEVESEEEEDMEDYEEGEIRSDLNKEEHVHVENDTPVTESELPARNEQPWVRQGPPVDQESVDVNDALKKPSRVFGNGTTVHGDVDVLANEINNIGDGDFRSGGVIDLENMGQNGQADVGELNGPNMASEGGGPTPGTNLGKRYRIDRSPPSIGSMQGPSQRLFGQANFLEGESLDLNTPVMEDNVRKGGTDDVPVNISIGEVNEPELVSGAAEDQSDTRSQWETRGD